MTQKQQARWMAESIKEVFKTMVGIPLSLGAMTAKSSEELVDCVSAVVGMAGSLSVLVDVCCSRKAALQIASALYNEEIQEMNEEVLDAIGELVNMLTGVVKGKISKPGTQLALTVPFIISGDRYTIKRPLNATVAQLPLLLPDKSKFEFTVIVR